MTLSKDAPKFLKLELAGDTAWLGPVRATMI